MIAIIIAALFVGAFVGFFVAALLGMSGRIARDEEIAELRSNHNVR